MSSRITIVTKCIRYIDYAPKAAFTRHFGGPHSTDSILASHYALPCLKPETGGYNLCIGLLVRFHNHWVERLNNTRNQWAIVERSSFVLGSGFHPKTCLTPRSKGDLVCAARRSKTVCESRKHVNTSNLTGSLVIALSPGMRVGQRALCTRTPP